MHPPVRNRPTDYAKRSLAALWRGRERERERERERARARACAHARHKACLLLFFQVARRYGAIAIAIQAIARFIDGLTFLSSFFSLFFFSLPNGLARSIDRAAEHETSSCIVPRIVSRSCSLLECIYYARDACSMQCYTCTRMRACTRGCVFLN
jgi:hypothetical protein